MTPEEYYVSDEVLQNLHQVCLNKAEARLKAEECVRIFNRLDAVEIGQFVVVKQPGIVMKTIENTPH